MNLNRLPFLDRTRGLIMIFMALDHALFFWSVGRINNEGLPRLINGSVTYNPLGNADPLALMVMLLSNICAPGFLFIAGYVLAISVKKREVNGQSRSSIDRQLWRKGLLLIVFQLFIASPAFYLPLVIQSQTLAIISLGTFFSLSVLSTIGFSLLFLSFGRHLSPWNIVGISGFFYLFSQLLLPFFAKCFPANLTLVQAFQTLLVLPVPFSAGLLLNNNFPLIPWFLPMSLGWLYGNTYAEKRGVAYEAKRFKRAGISSLILFFILRLADIGDYLPSDGTFQGFMSLSKYPPSPDYLLFYLGLLFLTFFLFTQLPKNSRIGRILEDFGQAPLFFYNTHLWLYAAVPAMLHNFNSYSLKQGVQIWFIGLFILYPLCRVYLAMYSSTRIDKRQTEFAHGSKPIRRSKLKDFAYNYGKE